MKKYLFIVSILLFQQVMAFDIWVKPQINYNLNQDKNLQKYFNNDGFFSSGISMDVVYSNNFGIFGNINRIHFYAKETIASEIYTDKIHSIWTTVGIFKQFDFKNLPLFTKVKAGITYHYNNYSNIFDDKFYNGIVWGAEIGYHINSNFQVGLFTNYNNTKFKNTSYRNSQFTRHQFYLSGRNITDPHLTTGAYLAIKVW